MKADEAPERIYLPTAGDEIHYHMTSSKNDFKESIEYTRTDAFIEKACEFLKSYRQEIDDGLGYIAGIVNDETIEDFRKYMEE